MLKKLPEKLLLGQTIPISWNARSFNRHWLIFRNKRSFWFWKNYLFIRNNGKHEILVDQQDYRLRIYKTGFLRLTKILDYQPVVFNVTVNSIENQVRIPKALVQPKRMDLKNISIKTKNDKLASKVKMPAIKLSITNLNQQ